MFGSYCIKPTKYRAEESYTFQGGQNYKETDFVLDEPIATNSTPMKNMGHFSDLKNNLFHVRYDVRSTPNGKKAFVIHEIQSDANQSIAKSLTAKEYAATTRKKRKDTKKGKQFSKQPKRIAKKTRKYRR